MSDSTISPDLLFSVLCDDVRREANGKLMFLGIFETIASADFPTAHGTLFIANAWIGGMGDFTQRTRLLDPEGGLLIQDEETSFSLDSLRARHCVIARFDKVELPAPGEYAIEVLLDEGLKLRYPLWIHRNTT